MEKFEYFPIKCRTQRAIDLHKQLHQSDTESSNILVAAQSTYGNKSKKPLKSKV
jgi:hypothetical protein